MAAWQSQWLSGWGDTTAPIATITAGPTRTRMSRIAPVDSTEVTWTVNEATQAYQIRSVPSADASVATGVLIESGGGAAEGASQTATITDDELAAAGLSGDLLIKIFLQDTAGNWSSAG